MPRSTPLSYRAATMSLVAAGVVAAPAGAEAATVSITADGGGTQELKAGVSVGDPSPKINISPSDGKGYTLTIYGPNMDPALYVGCSFIPRTEDLEYQGNGSYLVSLREVDTNCTGSERPRFSFGVSAAASIAAPSAVLLRRHARTRQSLTHAFQLRFPLNSSPEITMAPGTPQVSADGATVSGAKDIFKGETAADGRSGTVNLQFPKSGIYSVFARGRVRARRPTPWGRPAIVRVVNPFELSRIRFIDSRGPSYRIAGYFDNKATRGRVVIDLARGSRQKKSNPRKSREYRRLGTVTIRKGRFTKRFKAGRRGLHRIRVSFAGAQKVAPGDAVTQVRLGGSRRR